MEEGDIESRKAKALEEIADRLARIQVLLERQALAEGW